MKRAQLESRSQRNFGKPVRGGSCQCGGRCDQRIEPPDRRDVAIAEILLRYEDNILAFTRADFPSSREAVSVGHKSFHLSAAYGMSFQTHLLSCLPR